MKTNTLGDKPFRIKHLYDLHPDQSSFSLHAHGHYEILWFLSGDITYLVEGHRYHPSPNDLLLFNIAETHHVVVNSDIPYERTVIEIDQSFLSQIDTEGRLFLPFKSHGLGENNLISSLSFPDNYCAQCIERLNAPSSDELSVQAAIFSLLTELGRVTLKTPLTSENKLLSAGVVNYINENITLPLSAEMVAKEFFISRTALYSLFRQATGSSLHQYVQAKRLILASKLLKTGKSAKDVCHLCGYGDYSAFFRAYKTMFGVTPLEDKKKITDK